MKPKVWLAVGATAFVLLAVAFGLLNKPKTGVATTQKADAEWPVDPMHERADGPAGRGGIPVRQADPAWSLNVRAPTSKRTAKEYASMPPTDLLATLDKGDDTWLKTLLELDTAEKRMEFYDECRGEIEPGAICRYEQKVALERTSEAEGMVAWVSYKPLDEGDGCVRYLACMTDREVGTKLPYPRDRDEVVVLAKAAHDNNVLADLIRHPERLEQLLASMEDLLSNDPGDTSPARAEYDAANLKRTIAYTRQVLERAREAGAG